jgi:hypothetical protein
MLSHKGFSSKFVKTICSLLDKGPVGVRINDTNIDNFETSRGVRQDDPMSPILFNFVADVFSRMLIKAAGQGHIKGLLRSFCPAEIISMQYANEYSPVSRKGLGFC